MEKKIKWDKETKTLSVSGGSKSNPITMKDVATYCGIGELKDGVLCGPFFEGFEIGFNSKLEPDFAIFCGPM